tara:strand:- start:1670 stop:4810 length:3141 start_codon:yes stop_codon:yes gene_type:complete
MSNITNIKLIDCNQQFSEQSRNNNTENSQALFTNQVGSIEVKAGDKISVLQSYVSEVGAAEGAIEIEGKYLETKDITYTELSYHVPNTNKILGYERINSSNVTEKIDLYDNKFSILINYYKTNNLECEYSLPRRFVYPDIDQTQEAENWDREDSFEFGKCQYLGRYTNLIQSGPNTGITEEYVVEEDLTYYHTGNISASGGLGIDKRNGYKLKNDNSRFLIFVREEVRFGLQTNPVYNLQDNEKLPNDFEYNEYIEKIDLELPKGFLSPSKIADTLTSQLRQTQKQKINTIESKAQFVDQTFNNTFPSASNISGSMVQNIALSTELNSNTYKTFYSAGESTNSSATWGAFENVADQDPTDIRNGPSNTYLSTYQYIGLKRPEIFIKGRNLARRLALYNSSYEDPYDYPTTSFNASKLSSGFFGHNGCGTAAMANDSFKWDLELVDFRKNSVGGGANLIVLNQKWDKNILSKMNELFIEQGKHDELFTNNNNYYKGVTTSLNSRFLHLNPYNASEFSSFKEVTRLGSDHMNENTLLYPLTRNENFGSVPLFFDYNSNYQNIYNEGISWEEGYSYGFALKYTDADGDWIALTIRNLDFRAKEETDSTIPLFLFTMNTLGVGGFQIKKNTRFGYDTHFNSFGTAAIGLTDGWSREMYKKISLCEAVPQRYKDGASPIDVPIAPIISSNYGQKVYLGSVAPFWNFNTVSARFEISDLHTPEYIQNKSRAGGLINYAVDKTATYPLTDGAGTPVYKLNKRLLNNTFTPSAMPYSSNEAEVDVDSTFFTGRYNVNFMNRNLEPWKVYDQISGIIIKSFGYSENTWDQGAMGIMGFSYEQFNSSRTSQNDLTTRIGNTNKDNLPYALTNALIESGDTIEFVCNVHSAQQYTPQVPLTLSFNGIGIPASNEGPFPAGYKHQILPPISKEQQSIVLSAVSLPRKLQNGYYIIRSDVLDDAPYIGGADSNQKSSVIAVMGKTNDTGDYFSGFAGEQFTFTKDKIISSITTTICNPDQTLANVNAKSSIIYKLESNQENNLNIVQQLLEEARSTSKK